MRFEGAALNERLHALWLFLPTFVAYTAVVYFIVGLHRNKWRFTSVPDLYNIFWASTVMALSLLVLDYVLVAPNFYGTFFFGKVTILLYWFLQMFFLGGLRVIYRYFHYARTINRSKKNAGLDANVDSRACRRRRSPFARYRERRGEKDLAGWRALAVGRRSRAVDPRHSSVGRHRRPRKGRVPIWRPAVTG